VEIGKLEEIFVQAGLDSTVEKGAIFLKEMQDARLRLDNDRLLKKAISDAGNVVLPFYYKPATVLGQSPDEEPEKALVAQALMDEAGVEGATWHHASELNLPIPVFLNASDGIGYINVFSVINGKEVDQIVRTEMPFCQYEELFLPTYTIKIITKYLNTPPEKAIADPGLEMILGGLQVPLDFYSEILIKATSLLLSGSSLMPIIKS